MRYRLKKVPYTLIVVSSLLLLLACIAVVYAQQPDASAGNQVVLAPSTSVTIGIVITIAGAGIGYGIGVGTIRSHLSDTDIHHTYTNLCDHFMPRRELRLLAKTMVVEVMKQMKEETNV